MTKALSLVPDATSVIRFVDGFYRAPVEGDFPVDQTGTAEETHATVIIPADSIRAGAWLRWVLLGTVDYGGGAPDNFTARLRWGEGGPVILMSTVTIGGAGTNLPWRLTAEFQCGGPPGPATQIAVWMHSLAQPGPSAGISHGGGTFDTTKKTKLVFTMQLASSSGLPHFRTLGSYMENF